jgi:carbon storage regulator
MLVLSRYRDESIYIGDDIKITVVDIRGDRVRIGIQAPTNVTVHRQEVYEAIAQQGVNSERPVAKTAATASTQPARKYPAPFAKELEGRKAKTISIDLNTSTIDVGGITSVVGK